MDLINSHIDITNLNLTYVIHDHSTNNFRVNLMNYLSFGKFKKLLRSNEVHALKNINLNIKSGDRVGFYGHNGAGKTSLLKTIAGIYTPTSGNLNVKGKILSVFELGAGFDLDLDGYENIIRSLIYKGYTFDFVKKNIDKIIDFSDLEDFINNPVRTYSQGMILRLMMSINLEQKHDIFLCDEMISVGDDSFQKKLSTRIDTLRSESEIFLLSSHSLDLLRLYCDKIVIMSYGEISDVTN